VINVTGQILLGIREIVLDSMILVGRGKQFLDQIHPTAAFPAPRFERRFGIGLNCGYLFRFRDVRIANVLGKHDDDVIATRSVPREIQIVRGNCGAEWTVGDTSAPEEITISSAVRLAIKHLRTAVWESPRRRFWNAAVRFGGPFRLQPPSLWRLRARKPRMHEDPRSGIP
jgi:hypothetical protein